MADTPGPAGTPCPVCGHYLNVFGCRPGECKDPERAGAPVIESRTENRAKAWQWADAYGDEGGAALLREAGGNGRVLLEAACSTEEIEPRVRALTEAAPEMEALLREETKDTLCIMVSPGEVGRRDGVTAPVSRCPPDSLCWWCQVRALLARIDKRSKGG